MLEAILQMLGEFPAKILRLVLALWHGDLGYDMHICVLRDKFYICNKFYILSTSLFHNFYICNKFYILHDKFYMCNEFNIFSDKFYIFLHVLKLRHKFYISEQVLYRN